MFYIPRWPENPKQLLWDQLAPTRKSRFFPTVSLTSGSISSIDVDKARETGGNQFYDVAISGHDYPPGICAHYRLSNITSIQNLRPSPPHDVIPVYFNVVECCCPGDPVAHKSRVTRLLYPIPTNVHHLVWTGPSGRLLFSHYNR